jgi:mRNA interferase RelE/StbE
LASQIDWDSQASRELHKLDKQVQREIIKYLDEKIAPQDDPRVFGEPLTANLKGLWRYRVGDYRLICKITQSRLHILVIKVGHRKKVYED